HIDPTHPSSTLFPYTTLFRSILGARDQVVDVRPEQRGKTIKDSHEDPRSTCVPAARRAAARRNLIAPPAQTPGCATGSLAQRARSEEHTSELQSRGQLVCRLL